MFPNRNLLWAHVLCDELARSGCTRVVVSPGSRSGPLAIGFREDGRFDLTVHVDERSAGFFALGLARATGEPVALVCTSGTAAANFFPAVIEAYESRVPLLVLTADRPPELRGIGSNQTIDQVKLYGAYVRAFIEVPLPEPNEEALTNLRAATCRAVGIATGPPSGPVHLNLPFREPLAPVRVPGDVPAGLSERSPLAVKGRPDGQPFSRIDRVRWTAADETIDELSRLIAAKPRGVLVAGPRTVNDAFATELAEFSGSTSHPVFADPLSGVRCATETSAVVSGYDAFLASAPLRRWLKPDWILRFGGSPTSKNLRRWLSDHAEVPQIVIDEDGRLHDEPRTAERIVRADAVDALRRLAKTTRPRRDSKWAAQIMALDRRVAEIHTGAGEAWEGSIPALAAGALGPEDLLFVSSSLPVRDLDRYGRLGAGGPRVLANRGASGIDGIISSGSGAAHGVKGRSILVVGDLAFHHDLNGLSALRRYAERGLVVVINNGGGAIFGLLPIAEHEPHFTELFLTPHDLDFEGAARLFGLPFHKLGNVDEFPSAIQQVRTGILEVPVDREASLAVRSRLEESVLKDVERQIAAEPVAPSG